MLSRCWAALYPRANFLDVLEGNPDLYGPFWIATTVVLILFLGGTISDYLASTGQERFAYDFKLLSGMYRTGVLRLLPPKPAASLPRQALHMTVSQADQVDLWQVPPASYTVTPS